MRMFEVSTFVLLALAGHVLAGPVQLNQRQDVDTTRPGDASSTSPTADPTITTSTTIPASTITSPKVSQTVPSSVAISSATASPTLSVTSSLTPTPSQTAEPVADELPLAPRLTPGWGVAGAILLVTGIVYTLIGIKNPRLQTFFSTAYLGGVSTAVLIVYLLYPPIPDGIQGAYVVACVITGLLMGGAATIFHEMTEGFGCLVGGFCLGMWLLTLKAGGLLTKSSDKIIFITVFSVAGFATYFVHYIRGYAQIGFISFTGATVIVIGIDCFSRAGLKEFWAYIWNVNPNLFPPDTTSYPLTKGVTVETALIIILTIVGVISQLRLWKVIQIRRAKKAEQQAQLDRQRDEEETAVGQQIEAENARERRDWEKMYGAASEEPVQKPDNHLPTSAQSIAGDEAEAHRHEGALKSYSSSETIELSDIGPKEQADKDTRSAPGLMTSDKHMSTQVTVRVARDVTPTPPNLGQPSPTDGIEVHQSRYSPQSESGAHGGLGQQDQVSSLTPEIVPLPFSIPLRDEPQDGTRHDIDDDEDDDRSSFATFADDDDERSMMGSKRASRASFGTIGNRLSIGSNHLLRKLSSHSVLSRASHRPFSGSQLLADEATTNGPRPNRQSAANTLRLDLPDDADVPSLKTPSQLAALPSPTTPSSEQPCTKTEASTGPVELTADRLPNSSSRVALSYRTNEWAKHLSQAETPRLERLSLNQYSEPVHEGEAPAEVVAPVNVDTLQRTDGGIPLTSAPQPVTRQVRSPVDNPSPQDIRQISDVQPGGPTAMTGSSQGVASSSGVPNAYRRRSHRLSTVGTPPPIAEESGISKQSVPIMEGSMPEADDEQAHLPGYVSIPGIISYDSPQTLLGQREMFLRNKSTPVLAPYGLVQQQEARPARASHLSSQYVESDQHQPSSAGKPRQPADLDDLTLAQRKQLMRQNSITSQASKINYNPNAIGMAYSTPNLGTTLGSYTHHQYASAEVAQFDSHQPQRTSSVPTAVQREQALANFRQTVATDIRSSSAMVNLPQSRTAPSAYRAPGQGVSLINYVQNSSAPSSGATTPSSMPFQIDPTSVLERSRSMLIAQKEQDARKKEMEAQRKEQNDRAFEEMMRRGDLLDVHRDALRRMQSTAK